MTDGDTNDAAFASLHEQLSSLAAVHPELHLSFAADPRDGSYYQPAFRPVLTGADMKRGGEVGELSELAALWAGTPLAALLPALDRFAQTLARERAFKTHDPDAPSTLIYQMY